MKTQPSSLSFVRKALLVPGLLLALVPGCSNQSDLDQTRLIPTQAQLDKAYARYKAAEPAEALAALDRFIKLHPASPAIDYALYLKGIINFNDDLGLFSFITRQDLSERDQKAAKESFESFKELVFPPRATHPMHGRA